MKFSRGVRAYRDGVLFREWDTTSEAAEWLRGHVNPKATRGRVYDAACGIRKSAYGFTWELTGPAKRTYGSAKEDDPRLYKIWTRMKSRTSDPRDGSYPYEGGAGIGVCDEWRGYDGFREWADASGYGDGKVLMRRDLSADYGPDNCFWGYPLLDRGSVLTHQRRPVVRRDKDGRVTRYGSETEAALALIAEGRGNVRGDVTMTMSNIECCLKRKTATAYGSVWWYEGDDEAPETPGSGYAI